jgi:dihydropteroate synthase
MKNEKIEGYFEDISVSEKLEDIKATYTPDEFSSDPKGYFLIKVNKKESAIEVGYCTPDNVLQKRILGKTPLEIIYTILKLNLVSKFEHAADLGSELQKAYIALNNNLEYIQDQDLKLN